MEGLRQFGGTDVAAGFDVEDLFGLALFVANDAAVDRLDLEGGFLRGYECLLLDGFLHLRAAQRSVEFLIDRHPHPILIDWQHDGRAPQEGLSIVQSEND